MSVATTLETVGGDVKGFFAKLVADVAKAKQIWTLISSQQTRALLLKIGADAITLAKDAGGSVEAKGLNFTLDEATYDDLKALIADAKAGDGIILADLKVMGIKL